MFAQRSTLERLRDEIRENEQDAIRLEAAQQARGESGGKALEAVLAMEGVHGTISDLGKAPRSMPRPSTSPRETSSISLSATTTRLRQMRSGT